MTSDQIQDLGRRLVALAEVFDKKLTTPQTMLYIEALKDLPFEAVVGALNQAVKASKYFPRPAEIRTYALGDAEDVTENAWIAFRQAMGRVGSYASVIVHDAALAETVTAMFGGWVEACHAEFTPEMWAAKRKEFGRVYRVMQGRRLDGARYLTGLSEQQNSARALQTRFIPVGRIGRDGSVRAHLSHAECEQERLLIAAQAHGLQGIGDGLQSLMPRRLENHTDGAA